MGFKVKTSEKEQVKDITKYVEREVKGKKGKAVLCYVPHSTCALIVNENADPNIGEDILDCLRMNVREGVWRHDSIDKNGASHIKSSILGASVLIPLKDGVMRLGTWQNIFLCEFDGPKERRVIVEVI